MKPRTTIKFFSWLFMVIGLFGLWIVAMSSTYDPASPVVPLTLVILAMVGFGFLAYLDKDADRSAE